MLDEVESFSTYADVADEDELDNRPRRGRPPKPWRQTTDVPSWLDALGIAG